MRGLGLLGRGLVDGMSYEYMIPLHAYCMDWKRASYVFYLVILTRQLLNSFI